MSLPPLAMALGLSPEQFLAVSEYMEAVRLCTHPSGFQGFEDVIEAEQDDENSPAIIPDDENILEFYQGRGQSSCPPPDGEARFVLVWGGGRYRFLRRNQLAVVVETRSTTIAVRANICHRIVHG